MQSPTSTASQRLQRKCHFCSVCRSFTTTLFTYLGGNTPWYQQSAAVGRIHIDVDVQDNWERRKKTSFDLFSNSNFIINGEEIIIKVFADVVTHNLMFNYEICVCVVVSFPLPFSSYIFYKISSNCCCIYFWYSACKCISSFTCLGGFRKLQAGKLMLNIVKLRVFYQPGSEPALLCHSLTVCRHPRETGVVSRNRSTPPRSNTGRPLAPRWCGSLRPSEPASVTVTWGHDTG